MPAADTAGYPAAAASIVGIDRAESLLRMVRADRRARLVAGVLGPGGCGKSALLAALRLEYEAAGLPVVDARTLLLAAVPADAAVLVDDAHLTDPEVLQAITELVGRGTGSVVVAFRPWPRPPALTRLASAIRRYGPLTVLRQLGREEVGRRADAVLGCQLSGEWVDLLTDQTGGQPLVLDETLAALQETGIDPARPAIPPAVIDRLRFIVDDLDGDDRALLHAIAAGASVETGVLSALLGLDPALVREVVERVRAAGLLLGDGRLIPLVRSALLSAEPVEGTRDLQVRLLDIHAGLGHDVVPVARALAASGIRNHSAAAVLVAAADLQLASDAATAAVLYADAVRAGAAQPELAVRRAEAEVCLGHFDEAIQLADPVLADADSPDLPGAIDIIATVMAHRGQLGRVVELYRWLGPGRVGATAPMAALAMLATGEHEEAREFLAASVGRGCPTMVAGAMTLIAEGIQLSLTDSYTAAVSALSRATALLDSVGRDSLLLDSPAALTALVALHAGEFDLADSVLRRAISQQSGGVIARPRQLLLLAWTAMLRGREAEARMLLSEAAPSVGFAEQRDEIFAAAVDLGLARRSGDQAALTRSWIAARETILRQPIDLLVLLPLGEFVIAAAAMGDSHLLDTHLKQAWMLLSGLGDPDLWASPLRWSCVQAGVLASAVDEVERLCPPLAAGSPHNGYGRALASAARCWADLLGGVPKTAELQAAAAGLQTFGLSYEAARLLTAGSARSADQSTNDHLFLPARESEAAECFPATPMPLPPAAGRQPAANGPDPSADAPSVTGRDLALSPGPGSALPPEPGSAMTPRPAAARSPRRSAAVLSGREVQVARLLLRNQTYREIGERLFISPKTVEHHVARMKQRIGASRRSELFAQLRVLTDSLDG